MNKNKKIIIRGIEFSQEEINALTSQELGECEKLIEKIKDALSKGKAKGDRKGFEK